MIGVFVYNLIGLRNLIVQYPELKELIDGRRTTIKYNNTDPLQATASFSFVRKDLVKAIVEMFVADDEVNFEDFARTWTPKEIFGYWQYKRNASGEYVYLTGPDDEYGNPTQYRDTENIAKVEAAHDDYTSCWDYTLTDPDYQDGVLVGSKARDVLFWKLSKYDPEKDRVTL